MTYEGIHISTLIMIETQTDEAQENWLVKALSEALREATRGCEIKSAKVLQLRGIGKVK